ncbi:MAG: selenide, water dikinase SelD [Bdellovibrionota bacterium]
MSNIAPPSSSATSTAVPLTSLVRAGGCGSKFGPLDLRTALSNFPRFEDARLLFGSGSGDDAGVYLMSDDVAIVQTVDFFTPIVDDPYEFGMIAAANALSDCFALGAKPLTGLNILCFPCEIGFDLVKEILRGGAEQMKRAGGVILGGHSVRDTEPKYGIAITGSAHPSKIVMNTGAKPGDVLLITKKIGVGIVTGREKAQAGKSPEELDEPRLDKAVYREAVESMKTLNQSAAELMVEAGVKACTDVTGYGLLGHAHNLALASGVSLEISYSAVPKFPTIEVYAISGTKGGGDRNKLWIKDKVELVDGVGNSEFSILNDPQTSGPLLMAVDPSIADELVAKMKSAGVLAPTIIGRVLDGIAGTIRVVP